MSTDGGCAWCCIMQAREIHWSWSLHTTVIDAPLSFTAEQLQYLARALRRSGDDSMWIGLTHLGGTNFQWLSGAILNAADSSWAHGQPDSGDGCVEMWGDATWNDRPCRGDNWAHKVCACEVPVA